MAILDFNMFCHKRVLEASSLILNINEYVCNGKIINHLENYLKNLNRLIIKIFQIILKDY